MALHKRAICFAFATALALPVVAEAQTQPTPVATDALKPLQFLVGTWTAEGVTPSGEPYTLTRAWRSVLGGKFLLATETQKTTTAETHLELWIGFDPAQKALAAWEFVSNGSTFVSDSFSVSGDVISMSGRLLGSRTAPLRGTMRRNGNDRIIETLEMQRDGAWIAGASRTLARSNSASATTDSHRAKEPVNPAAKPLDLLTGNWRADGESDGAKYSVDYAFYWTLGGHFLRSDYSVTTNGQTEFHAASYSFFDPESKSLKQFGFSADGTTLTAKIRADATSGSVTFDGAITNSTRAIGLRTTYSRPETDTLAASTEIQRADGTWRRAGTGAFKRRP